jgi:pSer/pThr/pTyr-binding forkhead associated (FHA) protein
LLNSIKQAVTEKPPRLPKSAPKVRLAIITGPGAGQKVELSRCVSIIGSRPGCKLHLRASDVSPVHCAIVNTGEDIYVRDLMSESGTYLNDLKAQLEKLEDGDTLRISSWEMRIEISAYTVDTLSDLPHVSLEPEPSAFGVEVNGTGALVKLERAVGLVGRREGCDVVVRDKQVSRAHMLLFTYLSQPVCCDLLSNNGILLEGERVGFAALHSGDAVELGGTRMRLILPGVGRRETNGAGPRRTFDDASRSGSAGRSTLDSSGTGTVIHLSDDENGDRIDIRAAEQGDSDTR